MFTRNGEDKAGQVFFLLGIVESKIKYQVND